MNEPRYSAVLKSDRDMGADVAFEGLTPDVFLWLCMTARNLEAWEVFSAETNTYQDAITFVGWFRSVVLSLSETRIRLIVREELKSLMGSLKERAYPGSEAGDLEHAALSAIADVVEREEDQLPHAWDCAKRDRRKWNAKCTCGADKD